MTDEMLSLRSRITALLSTNARPAALYEGLETLAADDDFNECADIWAPALYARNPIFFENFLTRHLGENNEAVIQELLPRADADGHETLFAALYAKVIDELTWNQEMAAYASMPAADAVVAQALERRAVPNKYLTLDETTAAALYIRDPRRFTPFIQAHVRPGEVWREKRTRSYDALSAAAKARGDADLYWWLFRSFADGKLWAAEMRQLEQSNTDVASITDALQRRQITASMNLDTSALIPVVERFGAATFPYVDANLTWIGGETALRLIPIVERFGEIGLRRKIFFTFADPKTWQAEIDRIVAARLDDETVAQQLDRWLPSPASQRPWWLSSGNALTLYTRNPDRFRPFLLRTVYYPDAALFDQAERNGDEHFLDLLSARFFDQLATIITYKPASQKFITQKDLRTKASELMTTIGPRIIARFDRLGATPSHYVWHATAILNQSRGLGVTYYLGPDVANNPIHYLRTHHLDAWITTPGAISDLLESPYPTIIEMGINILLASATSTDAAQRVVENIIVLQALLLGPTRRPLKKLVAQTLENAAALGMPYAATILPTLAEAMHFHGQGAINERVMISFVRARRAAQTSA